MVKGSGNGKKIVRLETIVHYMDKEILDLKNTILKKLDEGSLEKGIFRADIRNGQDKIMTALTTHIEKCDDKIGKLNNFRYWILGGLGMGTLVITIALSYLSSSIK